VRLFIAITLPDAARRALENLQDRLRQVDSDRAIQWAGSDGFHITLKFLGEVSEARLTAIDSGLTAAIVSSAPFKLVANGIGCFPNPTQLQAIWAGIQGDLPALMAVQRAVESRIAPLGFPSDKRAFQPHLTFGRVRASTSRIKGEILGRKLSALEIGEVAKWSVTAMHLIRSDLRPSGAVYTMLASYPFPALEPQK